MLQYDTGIHHQGDVLRLAALAALLVLLEHLLAQQRPFMRSQLALCWRRLLGSRTGILLGNQRSTQGFALVRGSVFG